MAGLLIALLVLVGIAVLIGLWWVGTYNSFIKLKARIDEAWSGIDVQLKRRYDLIPNLVAVVQQYSIHEKSIFERIAQARAASMGATSIEGKAIAESQLTGALKTLFAVSENYPDLKANENFLSLQQQLSTIETDVQLARRYYNGTAREYNAAIAVFPSNIVASMNGFQRVPYFELNNEAEREAPKVEFKQQ